jgi:thiosulfate reductase / polysulfide reductase chain A
MVEVTRREIIRISTLGIYGLSVSPLIRAGSQISSVTLTDKRPRRSVPTICAMCPSRCGIIGFLEQDRLVALQGNPRHPINKGRICVKGVAAINIVYDTERVTTPLRRVGPRGKGQWKPVGWSEALSEISETLSRLPEKGPHPQIVVISDWRRQLGLAERFFDTLQAKTFVGGVDGADFNRQAAYDFIYGVSAGRPDVRNAKYILNFGANPYEEGENFISFVRDLVDARVENRAKLVTLDPMLTNTGGLSDEWIPIRPGTSAAIALAIAHVIVSENLHESSYLSRWTNISDADLRLHLSKFTPQMAESASGVPAEQIVKIAGEFAKNRPSVCFSGKEVTDRKSGAEAERAIQLLNIISGNIGRSGGFIPAETDVQAMKRPLFTPHAVFSQGSRIDLLISSKVNPVYEGPDPEEVTRQLCDEKAVGLSVVFDTHLTETANLADLVLPATTGLEEWNLFVGPDFVSLGQPVCEPRGAAKSFDDFCCELARRIGGSVGAGVGVSSASDEVKVQMSRIGVDVSELKSDGVIRTNPKKNSVHGSKIRIRAESNKNWLKLPDYVPVERGDLSLILFSSAIHTSRTANCKWLAEIQHKTPLLIHAEKAGELGIKNGDRVRISAGNKSIQAVAEITQGIHREAVAMAWGGGHEGYGNIARARSFESNDADTNLLWWHKEGYGSQASLLIKEIVDPTGGGIAWRDTKVKVEKI